MRGQRLHARMRMHTTIETTREGDRKVRDNSSKVIHLTDYQPFSHDVEHVSLTFRLDPKNTVVTSRIRFVPKTRDADLVLHGENLVLKSARIDGQAVPTQVDERSLAIAAGHLPQEAFTLETEVETAPADNTELEGLYMSNGMYCTQCEAEGFRQITYYPDRPDVMAPFTVRIESDLPVLLSNGNPTGRGDGWAEWTDPWPKSSYLFALVAGDLVNYPGRFVTRSGREVELNVWVRPADHDKCAFAMESLKKAMKWDEDV